MHIFFQFSCEEKMMWKRIQCFAKLNGYHIYLWERQSSLSLPISLSRKYSVKTSCDVDTLTVLGNSYNTDKITNVTPKILEKMGKNLHCKHNHPLNLITRRIENYFNNNYRNNWRAPMFSKFDRISPVVALTQNFDSLLVPSDHPSRALSESYYLNSEYMLRAHTSAHQSDLIKQGLDAFLVLGDVYRRDTVDASHYPVFHQMEGVRLFSKQEVSMVYISMQMPNEFNVMIKCGYVDNRMFISNLKIYLYIFSCQCLFFEICVQAKWLLLQIAAYFIEIYITDHLAMYEITT